MIWTHHNGDVETTDFDGDAAGEQEAGELYSQLRRDGMPSASMWEVRRFA